MESKITEHLKSLGCKCNIKIALAYQVYVELFEVRTMYDVDFYYDKDLEIVYLKAKPTKKSNFHIFIPYSTSKPVSMKDIEEFQEKLCSDSEKSITMACVEGDSSVVLYTFTGDLINIKDPEYLTRHKTRLERRDVLENEIRKSKYSIIMDAYKQCVIDD